MIIAFDSGCSACPGSRACPIRADRASGAAEARRIASMQRCSRIRLSPSWIATPRDRDNLPPTIVRCPCATPLPMRSSRTNNRRRHFPKFPILPVWAERQRDKLPLAPETPQSADRSHPAASTPLIRRPITAQAWPKYRAVPARHPEGVGPSRMTAQQFNHAPCTHSKIQFRSRRLAEPPGLYHEV